MNRQSILLAVLAAILVVALWWLFLYSPGQEQLASVQDEISAAQTEQASLQQRVASLESVRARAPETEAAIARVESIVPLDPALAAALRQIVAAADDAGVTLDALTTARPSSAAEDEALSLFIQDVDITATGSYFQVVDFVRRIEDPTITSRALLFDNVTIAVSEYPELSVALSGRMFSVLEPVPAPPGEEAAPDDDDQEPADEDAEADTATSDEGASS